MRLSMIINLALIIALTASSAVLVSCTKDDDTKTPNTSLRWMDRTIYLAKADPSDQNRNNFFQKEKVKEALTSLEEMTSLGGNYFSFSEIDESQLNTSLDPSSSSDEPKSFILIWPDSVFNSYLNDVVSGQTPDPNAIAVINSSNKRKFFIIVRASCIASTTVDTSNCSNLGYQGFDALIARQMGLLVGLTTKDCTLSPTDIMCALHPSDAQFSAESQLHFSSAFNNSLETILQNPSFYNQQ